jgi:glycosyltransferase involved in cell wall biosynthesis
MKDNLFSVVIPTRNRPNFLNDLIKKINISAENLIEILIIDSSDNFHKSIKLKNQKVKYIHSKIKSAAVQRNIGIDKVSKKAKYIFFLDDDVLIKHDYFEKLMELISQSNVIGGSGIAISSSNSAERKIPSGLIGLYKRMFLLDSKHDGKLLKSAINIPCRLNNESHSSIFEVDWLIGCAVWKTSIFNELRFEKSFTGQSLGEDLLFSNIAKKKGKLVVNRNILIDHREAKDERPNEHDFYQMWIHNRYQISKQLKLSPLNLAYHWANFGTLLLNIFKKQNNYMTNVNITKSILKAYKELLTRKI